MIPKEVIDEIRAVEEYEKYKDELEPLLKHIVEKCKESYIPVEYVIKQLQKKEGDLWW